MSTSLLVEPRTVPLTQTDDGDWRITGTRISLERVIECFKQSMSPEQIAEAFDTLRLSDVYVVIGYYLDHKDEVEQYLQWCDAKAAEIRKEIESHQPPSANLREELLARKARMEKTNAASAQ